jgi:hypothetical protein
MSVYVTARRRYAGVLPEYVLMDGDQVLTSLTPFRNVPDAFNHSFLKSKEEFDWNGAGYLKINWSWRDDWDEYLAKQKRERYLRNKKRAEEMVELLRPHLNAPYVEAECVVTGR